MPIDHHNKAIDNAELPAIIKAALNNNFGLSLYRLPGENKIQIVYGPCEKFSLYELPHQKSFIVAPFNNEGTVLAIQPSEVFPLENQVNEQLPWHLKPAKDEGMDKDAYKKLVRYGIEQIKAGSFDKVVTTNKQVVDLPDQFDTLTYFNKLEQAYPDAFVHLTSTPQYGTWVGATPELLLSFDESSIHTEALAGTRSSEEESDFSDKDKQEQDLVAHYIENCFENLAIDYQKTGPQTIKAGNLNHLKTFYEANSNGQTKQAWKQLLKCLHPTPAVGGYPFSVTQIFIRNEEPFDRELYSGFLGPVYLHKNSNLFVNLRCMEIHGSKSSLYAGAGIVKGSQSEEEYNETEAKMKTLLDLIEQ